MRDENSRRRQDIGRGFTLYRGVVEGGFPLLEEEEKAGVKGKIGGMAHQGLV